MLIPFRGFTGEFPRVPAHLLPATAAQEAIDCDFSRGVLTGLRQRAPTPGISGAGVKSLFVYDGGLTSGTTFTWTRDVDAVRSPVPNDEYARFYWSDGDGFWVSRGDLGGGGEPSSSYRVGVPRPAAAPVIEWAATAESNATLTFVLCDERADGTTENCVEVTATPVFTATSGTWVFEARAAQTADGSTTTTPDSLPSGLKPWGDVPVTTDQGMASSALAVRARVYTTNGADPYYSGTTAYAYFDEPAGQPATITCMHTLGEGEGINYNARVYYRLEESMWYSTQSGAAAPSDTNTTSSNSPFIGSVLTITITRTDGAVFVAKVRADATKTSWPPELPCYIASLTISGTTYTLVIARGSDYIQSRDYVYTYVNQYNEEGAPSDQVSVEVAEDGVVQLRYVPPPPSGYCPVSRIRVYRTATGSSTEYLYVGEAEIASDPVFTDGLRDEALGEPLSTQGYYPPEQTLVGICMMANGIMCGFSGNELHFSEPYLPYAWNPQAIKPFSHRIVGVCPFEGGLYVTTTAHPHIVMGASPDAMTDAKVPAIQAGVTKGSICNLGPYVAYASHDGLVLARGLDASLEQSFKFWTRDEWRTLYGNKLANIRLNAHDGSVVVWFDDGTPGFLLRLEEEALSLTQLSEPIQAAFVHPLADALYVAAGSAVYEFCAGAARNPFTWRSKDFILPKPTNLGVAQLVGDGSVTLEVYADDNLRFTQEVTLVDTGALVRLPAGFLARSWSFGLAGAGEVREMYAATTIPELQNV